MPFSFFRRNPEADGGFVRSPAPDVPEATRFAFLLSFAALLAILAFCFDRPSDILKGSRIILLSPANLVTDYFALANVGAALINASLMTFLGILLVRAARVRVSGTVIAAIFTLAGFSLFGKNLINSLPIVFGVFTYARLGRTPFDRYLLQALYGTALGPLVSEIAFNLGLPQPAGLVLGVLAGMLAGFVLPPLSNHFLRFHQGFNLYNIGFTAGIVSMFFIAVLRSFGVEVSTVNLVSSYSNRSPAILLSLAFLLMLLFGLRLNGWRLTGFRHLLHQSGRLVTDFCLVSGFGLAVVNMALLGFAATAYVLLAGGRLNGPVIGGILTVVGFGAYGKHLRNVLPIFAGVFLIGLFNRYDSRSTVAMLTALFGTTLAPVSGYYGTLAGVLAGSLHAAMVMNISYLHAGMNLYNNGFSGGFIAAALVPFFDGIRNMADVRKKERGHGKHGS